MTIDEAIKHCLEVAGEQQERADSAEMIDVLDGLDVEACKECAADHRQLAEWLVDYKELKAADVQPVKHGRWIGINEYCKKNGYIPSGMGIYYWCSECGKEEPKISDYCPNCGARMDGEQE